MPNLAIYQGHELDLAAWIVPTNCPALATVFALVNTVPKILPEANQRIDKALEAVTATILVPDQNRAKWLQPVFEG
jgi:hypothetical protein